MGPPQRSHVLGTGYIEKTLKKYSSDNKRHNFFIFDEYHHLVVLNQVVVKMAPSWRSQSLCGFYCSLTLIHVAVGWPAVYVWGISWSYSLFTLTCIVKT